MAVNCCHQAILEKTLKEKNKMKFPHEDICIFRNQSIDVIPAPVDFSFPSRCNHANND